MNQDTSRTLGQRLYKRRQKLALKQTDVAALSGVSPATISELETGKLRNPGFFTVVSIAEALDMRVGNLVVRN